MDRRRFVAGLAALAVPAGLAGCSVTVPRPGTPELRTQATHDAFVGDGFQPTVVVTGEATNTGSVYVREALLTGRRFGGSGETVDGRSAVLERIERHETRSFHFVFPWRRPTRRRSTVSTSSSRVGRPAAPETLWSSRIRSVGQKT